MQTIKFIEYSDRYFDQCLELFDANCPNYFSENEKSDYIVFLTSKPAGYLLGITEASIVSAFGFASDPTSSRGRVSWILVCPKFKGNGIGVEMISMAISKAKSKNLAAIDIAASHLSAPFFAKYGAVQLNETPHGWGENMHRIDMEIDL